MTDVEVKARIAALAEKYPEVEKLSFTYYGGGDSFGDMYLNDVDYVDEDVAPEINEEDFEEVSWEMIERVGSNFNNEGSEGTIYYDLKAQTVQIKDYYIVHSSEFNMEITI